MKLSLSNQDSLMEPNPEKPFYSSLLNSKGKRRPWKEDDDEERIEAAPNLNIIIIAVSFSSKHNLVRPQLRG